MRRTTKKRGKRKQTSYEQISQKVEWVFMKGYMHFFGWIKEYFPPACALSCLWFFPSISRTNFPIANVFVVVCWRDDASGYCFTMCECIFFCENCRIICRVAVVRAFYLRVHHSRACFVELYMRRMSNKLNQPQTVAQFECFRSNKKT